VDLDIEGTDEVTTIPNSLGVCDEWWLFRPLNACPLNAYNAYLNA
jgi:hypothetical protein